MPDVVRRREEGAPSSNARAVAQIEVDSLFGTYSYCIPPKGATGDFSRMLALYGNNGCGKTTLLTLLFRMLSPVDSVGHKSYLAKTPFRRFCVTFQDGASVEAVRHPSNVVGPYRLIVSGPN